MAIGTDERSNAGADTKKSERIYGDGSNGRIYGEQTQNEKTEEAEEAEAEDADRSDCVYAYVYGWRDEDKRKELAETIGCNVEEIVMFEYTGEASYSTYNRV